MIDFDNVLNSAAAFVEYKEKIEKMERMQSEKRVNEFSAASAGLVQQLEIQNKILDEQVDLLKEENERQKQQLAQAQINEDIARVEAKKSRKFSYFSFAVTTIISVVAVIISCIL